MLKVVIDPGHGGPDPGAVNGKIYEKDINLEIALLVDKLSYYTPAEITLTRYKDIALHNDKDIDLKRRGEAGKNADIFISLHCDSALDNQANGASLYLNFSSALSSFFGLILQDNMKKFAIPFNVRHVEAKPNKEGNNDYYAVLRAIPSGVCALIYEMCFLSNASDLQKIKEKEVQQKIALCILTSINVYFIKLLSSEVQLLEVILKDKRAIIEKQSKIILDLKKLLNGR